MLYTLLVFIPISFFALLASFTGRMALMVPLWHAFAWWMGVTVRVHGKAPPESTPSVWVANHFNWFDWPMLQVAARYKLYAVVKARRARSGCSAPAGADALALPGAKQAPALRAWRRGPCRADACHARTSCRRTSPWRTRWRACWRRGATTWAQSSIRAATARAARCVPARASRALAVGRARVRALWLTRGARGLGACGRRCAARFRGTRARCSCFRRAPRKRMGRPWWTSCATAPSRPLLRPAKCCSRYALAYVGPPAALLPALARALLRLGAAQACRLGAARR